MIGPLRRRAPSPLLVAALLATLGVAGRARGDEPRLRVPVRADDPQRGPSDALVTLVVFADFECPYCGKVQATLIDLEQRYRRDLRIVFKHNPLSFHRQAEAAAEASLAAHAAGRFWPMHDLLFQNQRTLNRAALEGYAAQLGLDLAAFRDALDQHRYRARIEADAQLARSLGLTGTPSFVINGRRLVGAQPVTEFVRVVDEELAHARRLVAEEGVARADVYREVQRGAVTRAPTRPLPPRSPRPGQPDPATVYRVPVGRSPVKGRPTAKLTVVIFADFQCPFCARGPPTLEALAQKYGRDIRFVFKHNPLPFHQNAALAAEAAQAAEAQGKFWTLHDLLFRHQRALDRSALESYAAEAGLDLRRFRRALDRRTYKPQVEQDMRLAAQLGARGTPSFFINGRYLAGAQAVDSFVALCDTEKARAEALLRRGVRPRQLYDALVAKGATSVARPAAAAAPAEARLRVVVDPRDPSLGSLRAPVTMVVFSDFQCPFCGRLAPTLRQLAHRYPRELRIVFKQLPLPFHQHARLAAEASLAAHAQRHFWAMHDRLFAHQRDLDRGALMRHAAALGLDLDRFQRDLDNGTYRAQVEADARQAQDLGIRGTPTMVINGRKVAGAQPLERIVPVIDEALAEARGPTPRPRPRR